jgi:flagellar hook-associated protein 1
MACAAYRPSVSLVFQRFNFSLRFMSGLFGSLTQTVRALSAHSQGVETAGRNIANVNNPDYARQRVLLADRGTVSTPGGAQSLGIEAKAVEQIRDALLDTQVVRETSRTATLQAESDSLLRIQASLGESINRAAALDDVTASGLATSMTEFFNAFQSLAARPTDLGERQNLLQRSEQMTDRFNVTSERLGQMGADINAEIETEVLEINRRLASIATLNAQIGRMEINAPGTAVDLRDKRLAEIEQLSTAMNVETQVNAAEPSQLDVFVPDGTGAPVMLVELAVTPEVVSFDGSQLVAGTAATPISLNGGSVQGFLEVRDGPLADLHAGLDRLVNQMVSSVNGAYNPTGTTGDFFAVDPAAPAASVTLASGLTAATVKTSDGGSAGDNTIALAVAELAHQVFETSAGDQIDGSFIQSYAGLVSDLGRAVADTESRLEDQNTIETLVREQRQGLSGVSLDEEMADLLKYQRAFEASSRIVSIVDGLLDIVINRLGRG